MKSDRHFNSWIEIEEKRISRRVSIPHRVLFEINPQNMGAIEQMMLRGDRLPLSSQQLTSLRYYSLVNSPLATKNPHFADTFCLAFASSYSLTKQEIPKTVIRSQINLAGQIHQEIEQSLWQNPQQAAKIVEVHYWLTQEILQQLVLPKRNKIFWLSGLFCSALINLLLLSLTRYFFFSEYFGYLSIANISMVFLLGAIARYPLKNYFRAKILSNLINGFFAKTDIRRRLGFQLLSFWS